MIELVHLRCGDPPSSGASKNFLTGEMEAGISVYEGFIRDGEAFLVLPAATYSACVSMSGCIERPVYRVEGDVIGRGSDGELLLANCRVLERVELHGAES